MLIRCSFQLIGTISPERDRPNDATQPIALRTTVTCASTGVCPLSTQPSLHINSRGPLASCVSPCLQPTCSLDVPLLQFNTMLSASLIGLLALTRLSNSAGLEPLSHKTFAYPNGIPYQVSGSDAGPRGPQSGYNICNSTTEGPNSQCQVRPSALYDPYDQPTPFRPSC